MYHLTGEDAIDTSSAITNPNNNDNNNTNEYNSNAIELDDFNNSYNDENTNNNNNNNNNSFMSYRSTDSIKPEWAVELLDEVRLLKEFLMSPKKNIDNDSNNNNSNNDNDDKEVIMKPSFDDLISTLKASIIDMITMTQEDSMKFDSFKVGVSTLIMYFNKIIENPQVPRYKRIHKANQNFRTLVEPMKGYEAVMMAAGFRDVGSNLEYYPTGNSTITPTSSPVKSSVDDADDDDAENKKKLLKTAIE
jgi:hypothetical protein